MAEPVSVVWLRRDLRLHDNAALYHALKSGRPVLVLFIFDRLILDILEDRRDRRVEFIHKHIHQLNDELTRLGSGMIARYGRPIDVVKQLTEEYTVADVYTNYDYEVYAKERDAVVKAMLAERGIGFHTSKDHTLLDRDEVLSGSGSPYTVFTPYSNNWLSKLGDFQLKSYPTEAYFNHFYKTTPGPIPTLAEMNFQPVGESYPEPIVSAELLQNYQKMRDYPARTGTSELGIHLRFGTISIRDLARQAKETSPTFLKELAWRDFYFQVLDHFPHVEKHAFRREYDNIPFRNNEAEFDRWCAGETGYPIVDAGMRQLNQTGWMHNRVRMIVASFCIKHLLIDWRLGEAYFAKKLRDFDLAANNGGWQWAAGSGTDAAPYFRVFNPTLQAQKFDPQGEYIRKWVPEFNNFGYPPPMVDHAFARQRAIDTYKRGLAK
ncbi:cryptochrome/photolyase family protein [Spirosoma montaniterrae]|uniref:Deoxyribodipyrimidine photolyase n=1 Tax=Spirosoma montaniterrae TaxID=1178516 RepID=A0A1P9WY50_9BACT|nr:deoxyribodipyrimidine photo-lyase [Spirosoma montaniterrae]AQG80248.1 deoxyribodipyrimidine photolyase [Spirosoma montaniterrae]